MVLENVVAYASREAWRAGRRETIGASEIGKLFGAIGDPLEVYLEKVGEHERESTARMRAGLAFERAIADFWSAENGFDLLSPGLIAETPFGCIPVWIAPGTRCSCTPDFFVRDMGGLYVVEVKRTSPELLKVDTASGGWKQGPPLCYVLQCQYQLMVLRACGLEVEHVFLVADFGGDNVQDFVLGADEELWTLMAAEAGRFWGEHVATQTPPNAGEFAKPQLLSRSWKSKAGSVCDLSDAPGLVIEWAQAQAAFELAEERLDRAKVDVQSRAKEAEVILCDGVKIATWKQQTAHYEARPASEVTSRPFKKAVGLAQFASREVPVES